MNYDFAQIRKVDGSEVMIKFTIVQDYKEGNKNKKVLKGVDESGNTYTATGINDDSYKINAHDVKRT